MKPNRGRDFGAGGNRNDSGPGGKKRFPGPPKGKSSFSGPRSRDGQEGNGFRRDDAGYRKPDSDRPFRKSYEDRGDRPARNDDRGDRKFSGSGRDFDRNRGGSNGPARPYSGRPFEERRSGDRPPPYSGRSGGEGFRKPYSGPRESKGYDRKRDGDAGKPYSDRNEGFGRRREDGPDRPFRKSYDDRGDRAPRNEDRGDRPQRFDKRDGDRPFRKSYDDRGDRAPRKDDRGDRPQRFDKRDGDRPFRKSYDDRAPRNDDRGDRPQRFDKRDGDRPQRFEKRDGDRSFRPSRDNGFSGDREFDRKRPAPRRNKFDNQRNDREGFRDDSNEDDQNPGEKARDFLDRYQDSEQGGTKEKRRRYHDEEEEDEVQAEEQMPLNKYIAHCGVCGRREAAEMVKQGKARVNGELILEPGYKIQEGDSVTLAGKKIFVQRNLVYLLLNKPKGFITTTDDPQGRRTVMELVQGAGVDRIYPIGRLDRNTTGVLLMTNDGALAQKLSHPKYEVKKVYQVTLDRALEEADYAKITAGLELEDGPVKVDALAYLDTPNELGIEIHSGRNRIVRRIFEALKYDVVKLDRVVYAGLTKKNVPRGKWRELSEQEIIRLKHFKL